MKYMDNEINEIDKISVSYCSKESCCIINKFSGFVVVGFASMSLSSSVHNHICAG